MVQPRVRRIWAGAEASRDVLNIILLFRRPEIAFACCGPHTLLTHSELIVGENHCTPSGARPLGFGAAVLDSTFAWSCFLLLDLAPRYGLGRSSLDPDSLPGPRPLQMPAPGLPQFPSAARPPPPKPPAHPAASVCHGLRPCPLLAAWPQVDRPLYAETHALRASFRSSQQGSQVTKGWA